MRYSALLFVMVVALVVVVIPGLSAQNDTTTQQRVELTLYPSEAKQALVNLAQGAVKRSDDDWQKLFATIPYQWLNVRDVDAT